MLVCQEGISIHIYKYKYIHMKKYVRLYIIYMFIHMKVMPH